MEELVGFRSWNLEADKAFARDDGLVALTAVNSCFAFHKSPPLCLMPLFGKRKRCPPREIQATTVNFLLVHARDFAAAAKKWQWTGNPPSQESRSPAKLQSGMRLGRVPPLSNFLQPPPGDTLALI
jgi:hypothetical protein